MLISGSEEIGLENITHKINSHWDQSKLIVLLQFFFEKCEL